MPNIDDPEPFDCQACGACCVEAGAVILADEDDVPAALVQRVANLRCMATEGTSFRCAALLGTVGRAVACGIYGRRPDVCRSFDAGSDECLAARGAMRAKLSDPGARSPGYDARVLPGALGGCSVLGGCTPDTQREELPGGPDGRLNAGQRRGIHDGSAPGERWR